jgi:hypothetical protein
MRTVALFRCSRPTKDTCADKHTYRFPRMTMVALEAYSHTVDFSLAGPNNPRFGLHLANIDPGTCNVVVDSAVELIFCRKLCINMYFWKKLCRILGESFIRRQLKWTFLDCLKSHPDNRWNVANVTEWHEVRIYSSFARIRRLWCNSLHIGLYMFVLFGRFRSLYNCCTYIEISPLMQRYSVALVSNLYGFVGWIVVVMRWFPHTHVNCRCLLVFWKNSFPLKFRSGVQTSQASNHQWFSSLCVPALK